MNGTPRGGNVVDPAASPGDQLSVPAGRPADDRASQASSSWTRWPYWVAVGVLVVGLLVTGAFVLISNSQYTHNEQRVLDLVTEMHSGPSEDDTAIVGLRWSE